MTSEQNGAYKVALGSSDAAAGVLSVLNPEGVDLIITRFVEDVVTPSSGACTVDFGVAATAISNDTLIDGKSQATAGVFDNVEDQGTNGKSAVLWAAGTYLTGSKASGAAAGLAGYAYITYVRR